MKPNCPICPGQGVLLGVLGSIRYYRCRDCGIDFRRVVKPRCHR